MPGSITITAPVQYQVKQRNPATNQADLVITGSYTGSPAHIEASFNGGAYQTIVVSPAGGTYSGTLSAQTAGQGTLTVRHSDDTAVTASKTLVGIGDIFIIGGQSNAVGQGTNNQVYTHASLKAALFGNDYTWKELVDPTDSNSGQVDTVSRDSTPLGSPWPLLATSIMADQGVPVAFVPCALGGTTISQWLPGANHFDRTTLYGSMAYRIQAVGGARCILWFQAESDIVAGTSVATYFSSFGTIASALATDVGVPIMPCLLPTEANSLAASPAEYDMNKALHLCQAWTPNARRGPDLARMLCDSADLKHLTTDANLALEASLWWRAIKAALY